MLTDDTATVAEQVEAWLDSNWDPELTVRAWWEKLAESGWAVPTWPTDWFGRGLSRDEAIVVQTAIARHGALGAPTGFGPIMAGPTILTHGSEAQKQRYLPDIVTGRKCWCQLFSEPGAGSDLASLQTQGIQDGEDWTVNGQKVWTSQGHLADMAMLLVRTNPDVPKHRGISFFAFDMHQPGVEVRPIREMTGRALFNEVFITDARVSDDALIGGRDNGWTVANTTLAFERAGLGAGGNAGGATATAGTVAGDLDRRAGDLVGQSGRRAGGDALAAAEAEKVLVQLAREKGSLSDPILRQDLMRLHTLNQLARYSNLRQRALAERQEEIPGLGNMAKLSMSRINRLARDLALRILGPAGTLHAYSPEGRAEMDKVLGNPVIGAVTEMALFAQGPSIYGGSDEIQHNILGERVLGLPREPSNDRTVAFKDLPKGP